MYYTNYVCYVKLIIIEYTNNIYTIIIVFVEFMHIYIFNSNENITPVWFNEVNTYTLVVFTTIMRKQSLLKVIHVHHDLRKMFITVVWNVQQSFYLHHFHIIVLPVLCVCQISIHYFIIELQYNHVLTL